MLKTINTEYTSNNLINAILKTNPKLKKSIEQMDSDSLNTMDYYQEDSSNKNNLIEEAKFNKQIIYNNPLQNNHKEFKKKTNQKRNDLSFTFNQTYREMHKSSNLVKVIHNKISTKRIKNVPKLSNATINSIDSTCNKCKSKLKNNKLCIKCKYYFCQNCFRGINNRNLDNNSDENENENCEQNFDGGNICHYCKFDFSVNKTKNMKKYKRNKLYLTNQFEPLDTSYEDNLENFRKGRSKTNANNNYNKEKIKNLEEQYKEYENFLNQIENRKKEIEIKRDIGLNILEMIKKVINYEYERNLKKLNEFQMKLIKMKNNINEKMIKSQQNEIELQINIDISKNNLKNFIKNFEKFSQVIISRTLFRGYKSYESNNILINYSDSYYMNYKEVLSGLPFGNVYIKIDRYTNNYVNYLNFATLIKLSDKTSCEDTINSNTSFQSNTNNKSRFVVNMIVNGKVIRFIKTNKDNTDTTLSYESSEKENEILFCKDRINSTGGFIKKNNFNIKVIINEVML